MRRYNCLQVIKTVIFDLGGVIVPFDFKRGYARIEALCGYPAAEIPVRLRSTGLVPRFESGEIEARDFVQQLCSVLELRASYEEFCDLWTSIFMPETLIPESLLESIRQRHRLVLLSNTNSIHFEMVERAYPLLRQFDEYVLSYRVRAMKPSPAIYRQAIAAARCSPEECFFTDDIAQYVEGARAEGIDAVQCQSLEQLEGELKSRAIL